MLKIIRLLGITISYCFAVNTLNCNSFENTQNQNTLESVAYSPSPEFRSKALINDDSLHKEANKNLTAFWDKQANCLDWFEKWNTTLKWDPPFSEWFIGGKLNACYNCLDRHIKAGRGDKKAIIWQGEPGDERILTYNDLYDEVNKFANVLKSIGVKKGDTVALYMSMVPETVIALLACGRIGAPHAVIFGGIGAGGVKDRLLDCNAKFVITVDGCLRKGKAFPYKGVVDEALQSCQNVKKVIVVKRAGNNINFDVNRDSWYHELMSKADSYCPPEVMDSEDLLFILYTSGSTGKSKGIMHSTAGYLVGVCNTFKWVFDIKQDDIYWSTADIGWITGHSFAVYGPLLNGATTVMYEGAPDYPDKDRFWSIIEQYKVSIFYTAPTAIRMFMKWGENHIQKHDISSLRLIGSIGEPINPEVWEWYHEYIGAKHCPIVDTWFQTETGGLVISPLPGLTDLKPGSVTKPLPGYDVAVLDEEGNEVEKGFLAIRNPYPSMMRGIYGDNDRYKKTYWCKWDGKYYYTGDGAIKDKDGYIWVIGRLDDVLKISGHRIGTAEIESALVENPCVAEAAVIGIDDKIKGHDVVAFVMLKESAKQKNMSLCDLEKMLKENVVNGVGAFARPRHIIIVDQLPKNRSGKIMRRLLRNLIEGAPLGDITTLENIDTIVDLKNKCDAARSQVKNQAERETHSAGSQNNLQFACQEPNFHSVLSKTLATKNDFLLSSIKRDSRNKQYKYTLKSFDYKNQEELARISRLIRNNFLQRPEFKDVPENIKKLYCQANTETGLVSAMEEKYTHAYILNADDESVGFVMVRFNLSDLSLPFLQIKRMHSFYELCNKNIYGAGKTLLNLVATIASAGGVKTILTTAPYPIKGYFEHLNWNGQMIYTDYALENITVKLPQFKCSYTIPDDFRGF